MSKKSLHPVFEKEASQDEKACWEEARFFARELIASSNAAFEYVNGDAGDPTSAFAALSQALRVSSAVERALSHRKTRLNYDKKRRVTK